MIKLQENFEYYRFKFSDQIQEWKAKREFLTTFIEELDETILNSLKYYYSEVNQEFQKYHEESSLILDQIGYIWKDVVIGFNKVFLNNNYDQEIQNFKHILNSYTNTYDKNINAKNKAAALIASNGIDFTLENLSEETKIKIIYDLEEAKDLFKGIDDKLVQINPTENLKEYVNKLLTKSNSCKKLINKANRFFGKGEKAVDKLKTRLNTFLEDISDVLEDMDSMSIQYDKLIKIITIFIKRADNC